MVLGTGGIAIVPYVKNKRIYYNLVLQDRITIDNKTGDLITGATILAESKVISDLISQKIYYRWTNYQIVNNNLIIQQKFTDENGEETALSESIKCVYSGKVGYFAEQFKNMIDLYRQNRRIYIKSMFYEILSKISQQLNEDETGIISEGIKYIENNNRAISVEPE